ncbi:MAG TPA: type II secretion system F family protein [Tepidisphaeraceae bacterium]|nr:type II secretion system F family protein [Tepidisphaeraceae bacterium]
MMNGIFPQLLIAGAAALMGWWIISIIADSTDGERKKLKDRLSGESATTPQSVAAGKPLVLTEQQSIPEILAGSAFIQKLQRHLSLAYPDLPLSRFLLFVTAGMAVGFGAAFLFFNQIIFSFGGAALGAYIPFFVLSVKRNRRQRMITMQLPEALDFLSRVMRAGHSFSTGLQMMADELPDPLSSEFRRCYDQHSLGQSLEDSLKDMATRVDSTDFAFFVTAVLIQRQAGGDLSEVLGNISAMIRARVRLMMSVKAKTAEGRLTGWIMVAFPGLMFCLAYYLNPEYGGTLLHTSMGLKLLGTAFGLAMLGLFMIKKITTVKV